MLRFENDSPEGDRSVFVDSISVSATAHTLAVVLPSSSADTQPYDFQLLTQPLTWYDAEAECERRNRKLASVHSIAENDYIASLHHSDDAATYGGFWIGAYDPPDGSGCAGFVDQSPCPDSDNQGVWSWIDGTEWDWHNWGAGEPNNGHGQACPANVRADGTCGEDWGMVAVHFAEWAPPNTAGYPDQGAGFERNSGRMNNQWNDGGTDATQAVCGAPSQSGSRTVLAYYSFDDASVRDWSGNHRDGIIDCGTAGGTTAETCTGEGVNFVEQGISGKAASFDGRGRITIPAFRNWAWGNHFAVSIWFLRDPSGVGNYQ